MTGIPSLLEIFATSPGNEPLHESFVQNAIEAARDLCITSPVEMWVDLVGDLRAASSPTCCASPETIRRAAATLDSVLARLEGN